LTKWPGGEERIFEMKKLYVILASTRENRQGGKVADWVMKNISGKSDWQVELLDLKEWNLPFLEEECNPEYGDCEIKNETVKKWKEKIAEADGFIIVTPEYNHGYPGVLKNALDHAYAEYNNKPVGFVSYSTGKIAGARAVEQLRLVSIELQMAPIRNALGILNVKEAFSENGEVKEDKLYGNMQKFTDQLDWWTQALKQARVS
jgi:NAD(P)H-dependent FMN reductase